MLAWQIIALMNVERMSLSCRLLPIADITRLRSRSRTIVIVIYIYTSDDIFAGFLIQDDIIWFVCHFPYIVVFWTTHLSVCYSFNCKKHIAWCFVYDMLCMDDAV